MKKLGHLSEIFSFYDAFIIDLWGVMHDGVKIDQNANEVIQNLEKNNKRISFLSNAPRPSKNVNNFLRKINFEEKFLKDVITSGEIAMKSLQQKKFGEKFYHLGPPRDEPIFKDLEKNRTRIEDSDFILCTGLFDDQKKDLNFYKNLLANYTKKKFVCTNPDFTVHKGGVIEYCAGAVANTFEKIGGKVIYYGKPHKEVYESCLKKNEKTLAIGDNLNTDILGANNLGIDSLFITSGVHRAEFEDEKDLNNFLIKYKVSSTYFQEKLTW